MVFNSRRDKFGTLLISIAENLKEASDYFADAELNNVSDLKTLSEAMKEYKNKGNLYVHEVIKELNKVFITPIEREDILHLALSMDDVLDELEHCTALMEMYSLVNIDEYMKKLQEHICEAVYEIEKAVELISSKKLLSIRNHAIKIKEHESACDGLYRLCIKNLFVVEKDPIRIIQYKEMYECFEGIADYCQNVANMLETIIMKNA